MDDEDVCPDCLCHIGDPGEWEFWASGSDEPVIMCYCDCGCHEGMEPESLAG